MAEERENSGRGGFDLWHMTICLQTLVPKIVESLSQGLSKLPGYDPHKPDRGGYFDDLS